MRRTYELGRNTPPKPKKQITPMQTTLQSTRGRTGVFNSGNITSMQELFSLKNQYNGGASQSITDYSMNALAIRDSLTPSSAGASSSFFSYGNFSPSPSQGQSLSAFSGSNLSSSSAANTVSLVQGVTDKAKKVLGNVLGKKDFNDHYIKLKNILCFILDNFDSNFETAFPIYKLKIKLLFKEIAIAFDLGNESVFDDFEIDRFILLFNKKPFDEEKEITEFKENIKAKSQENLSFIYNYNVSGISDENLDEFVKYSLLSSLLIKKITLEIKKSEAEKVDKNFNTQVSSEKNRYLEKLKSQFSDNSVPVHSISNGWIPNLSNVLFQFKGDKETKIFKFYNLINKLYHFALISFEDVLIYGYAESFKSESFDDLSQKINLIKTHQFFSKNEIIEKLNEYVLDREMPEFNLYDTGINRGYTRAPLIHIDLFQQYFKTSNNMFKSFDLLANILLSFLEYDNAYTINDIFNKVASHNTAEEVTFLKRIFTEKKQKKALESLLCSSMGNFDTTSAPINLDMIKPIVKKLSNEEIKLKYQYYEKLKKVFQPGDTSRIITEYIDFTKSLKFLFYNVRESNFPNFANDKVFQTLNKYLKSSIQLELENENISQVYEKLATSEKKIIHIAEMKIISNLQIDGFVTLSGEKKEYLSKMIALKFIFLSQAKVIAEEINKLKSNQYVEGVANFLNLVPQQKVSFEKTSQFLSKVRLSESLTPEEKINMRFINPFFKYDKDRTDDAVTIQRSFRAHNKPKIKSEDVSLKQGDLPDISALTQKQIDRFVTIQRSFRACNEHKNKSEDKSKLLESYSSFLKQIRKNLRDLKDEISNRQALEKSLNPIYDYYSVQELKIMVKQNLTLIELLKPNEQEIQDKKKDLDIIFDFISAGVEYFRAYEVKREINENFPSKEVSFCEKLRLISLFHKHEKLKDFAERCTDESKQSWELRVHGTQKYGSELQMLSSINNKFDFLEKIIRGNAEKKTLANVEVSDSFYSK